MTIQYKCPECGAEVNVQIILTNPPITCYRCSKCDYHYDERGEDKVIIQVAPHPQKTR